MAIVLVHGNPETEAIWDDLVPHLRGDDVVRLSPPGFGSQIPSGFDCSTDAYRDWLAKEPTKSPQPIDLVGHDWGGGHVMRIAMERPGLIRSWTSDILGCFDADYVLHDMAQGGSRRPDTKSKKSCPSSTVLNTKVDVRKTGGLGRVPGGGVSR
jgi:hypothetical protein